MQGVVIIGSNDISNLVIDGSYKMDEEETYESWQDGNKLEHRTARVAKVSGSFNVVLSNKNNCTLSQFYQLMDNAATDGVIYAAVYVTNKGCVEAIDAYYSLENQDHILTVDGSFIDIVKVEIQER